MLYREINKNIWSYLYLFDFQDVSNEDPRSLEASGGHERSAGGRERSSRGLVPQLLPNYTEPQLPNASEVVFFLGSSTVDLNLQFFINLKSSLDIGT